MKHLFLWLILAVCVFGQTQIVTDLSNSTTTRLGAAGVFTGFAVDNNGGSKFSSIVVTVATNKAGTLRFQTSNDSTNWWTTDSISVSIGNIVTLSANPKMRYYRVKYTNGSDSITATYWAIQTIKYTMPIANSKISVSTIKTFESQDGFMRNDSLATGDTLRVIYFGHNYSDCFLTFRDSLGKGTTDTFYVERYDSFATQTAKQWTAVQVAFIDISSPPSYTTSNTGRYSYSGTNVILPGVGVTKSYYIGELRPGTYRVWVNSVDVFNGKKKRFSYTGKNR